MKQDDRLSLEPLRQFRRTTDLVPRMADAIHLQEKILHTPAQSGSNLEILASTLSAAERADINYSALIITLYGAVERFAEDFAKELAKCAAALAHNAGMIPEKINEEHLLRSMKYIEHLRSKKVEPIEPVTTVLSRLAGCMNGHSFELNTEAYGLHTANIRQESLAGMLSPLGLQDAVTMAISSESFQAVLYEKGRTETETTFHLDDLADRRNAVAHGRKIEDRLRVELFVEYAEVLAVFAEALVDAALTLLSAKAELKSAESLGVPTQTYKSGRVVVCCPPAEVQLRRGHRVMWKTPNGTTRVAKVEELQVDRLEAEDGTFPADREVGLLLDHKYTGQVANPDERPLLVVTRR